MRHLRLLPLVSFLLVFPGRLPAAPAPAPPALGHWEGAIQTPGLELQVKVDLTAEGGAFHGTIDIPQQGAKGLPLAGVAVPAGAEGAVRFSIQGIPGAPTFDGTLSGGEIQGTFSQGGRSFPFRLGRAALQSPAPPARPQEPKPPFPYLAEEVQYEANGVQLAGTLTLPRGEGPFPAVLLLTGSGAQNRDEEVFGHKPFLVIADHLTRAGIAVLRLDDRGVGGSTGSVPQSTTADFAADALAGVRFLKGHPHIAPGHVGLVGHSEGAIVASLAASRSRDVAFIVLLSGPGVPGSEVILDQMARIARAGGMPEAQIRAGVAEQTKLFDLMRSEKDPTRLKTQLRAFLRAQLAGGPEAGKAPGSDADQIVDLQIRELLSPWYRFFLTYDPRPALSQVKVPVLALSGELDLQAAPDLNLPEVAKALAAAKEEDVTIRRLPGLNHLLQHAKTGALSEYAASEETISPEVLDIMTRWILDRAGKTAPSGPRGN
jgi:uncharacterized protein